MPEFIVGQMYIEIAPMENANFNQYRMNRLLKGKIKEQEKQTNKRIAKIRD